MSSYWPRKMYKLYRENPRISAFSSRGSVLDRYQILICQSFNQISILYTVNILKFGTPQTIVLIVLKIEKFDVTLH